MPCKRVVLNGLFGKAAWILFLISLLNLGWMPFSQKKRVEAGSEQPVTDGFSSSSRPDADARSETPAIELEIDGSIARLSGFKAYPGDIPSNVTVKSRHDLRLVHPHTIQEAVQDAEGIVLYDSVGNGWDETLGLRGFSEGSAMAVLVDGVRVNELDGGGVIYPLLPMQDIDSVQIVRGSGSPIYGSGAFAGVMNIKTGQPSPKPVSLFGGFEVSSHQGKNFYQGMSGTLRDPLFPWGGRWKYYFKGGRDIGDGFRGNSGYRLTNFDLKTSYELPDEDGRIYFNWKHANDLIKNPGEMTFQQFQEDPSRTNKPLDRRDYESTILQWGADKNFFEDRLLASMMTSWRWNITHFFSTAVQMVNVPDTDRISEKTRATDLVWQLISQETWRWLHAQTLFGMEFRDASDRVQELDAFGGAITPDRAPETEQSGTPQSMALFWRERLGFGEKVEIHYGMRHDFARLQIDDQLTPANGIDQQWKDSTLSTGITVKPLRFVDLFANYSQGFRVPDMSEIAPYSSTSSYPTLRPEKADSYEIGTQLRLNEKGMLKFSYFLIDVTDEILFDSTSVTPANPWGQNTNIGKSRRAGIEIGTETTPVRELKLYGTYTWTKAYVRETQGDNWGEPWVDGRSLGQIPAHRLTWGVYCWPLKRFGENLEGLRISMNGIWTGRQHPTSYESTTEAVLAATGSSGHWIKSYAVWDLMLSYIWNGQEIYFKINNLFDQHYYSRAVNAEIFGTAAYPLGTYAFVNPGAPREFVGGLRWEIG
ncbi:MAG: TonB-dependent receptor [Candidatus Omnitrophota bacterium]